MNKQTRLTRQTPSIRSLELKAQRGEYPGKPPIGYINDTSTKQIVPDPKIWDVIKAILEKYATGEYTINQTTLLLNENLPTVQNCERQPLTKSQVIAILRNQFYIGKLKFRGKTYQGKHKPMISKEVFDEIQKHLECKKK